MSNYKKFLYAIHNKRKMEITFDSKEKGVITRICIPYDYGPSNIYKDGKDRYHTYNISSPEGSHNLSILPEQVIDIKITEDIFDPAHYITWEPKWHIKRDWGVYS